MANNEQNTEKPRQNLFTSLRRLFSSDVIIRNEGGGQLKVIDSDHIQTSGVIQTNALVDRFHKVYTTSTAYGVNLNLAQNYRSARVQIYADYDAMDTDAIIASALDIIADECTLKNEQGEVLQIRSSDENIQKILYNLFYSTLNIEFNLWSWIRNMCKYGDFYLKLEIADEYGVYNVIPFSAYNIAREEAFNPENPSEVRFKFDPNAAISATSGYSAISREDEQGIFFDNYEMAHFRLTGDVNYLPYGRSYLEPARKLFKQYVLIEDAMLIHRIVRAPEKRVFYVNIGAIPPGEVENFMQRMISKMKKTPLMDPQTGQYNLKYNVQNMLEDIYIPVRGNDATTRIDTAKGLDYNGIEDVQYFREKLFAALKIPKAFMGYEKDLTGKATLAAEDIRFARTVERIQRIATSELTKIALVHLYANGYTNESAANFTISLTNPSIIYEQERIALFKEKIDLANQALEAKILPRDFIYDKIFQFSEDQYAEMDDMIIEDQKRTFRYNQIVEEGNDPSETGQAFGTPHQLASLYGGKGNTTLDIPTGYDETNPNEPINLPGRPQKYKSRRGTDKATFGRDPMGKADLKSTADSGEDRGLGLGAPLALENTMVEFLRLKKSLNKINPKNTGRKTKLFEQSDAEGRKTSLYTQPEILQEDVIKDDSEFPKINRPIKEVKVDESQSIGVLLESTKRLDKEVEIREDDLLILNEKNILPDLELKLDNRVVVSEKLLNENKISDDLDIQPKTILTESVNTKDIVSAIDDLYEETLTNEDNILDESVIDSLTIASKKSKQNLEGLLNENDISDDSKFIAKEKTFKERLLNEKKIDGDGDFVNVRKMFPEPTLLESNNIIDENIFDDLDDSAKIPTILEENKIIEENKLVATPPTIPSPTLLEEGNIVEEKIFDELDATQPTVLLEEGNIVEEKLFDELDSTNPVVLLEEANIIPEEDKTDVNISNMLNEENIIEEKPKKRGRKKKDMLDDDNIKDI